MYICLLHGAVDGALVLLSSSPPRLDLEHVPLKAPMPISREGWLSPLCVNSSALLTKTRPSPALFAELFALQHETCFKNGESRERHPLVLMD